MHGESQRRLAFRCASREQAVTQNTSQNFEPISTNFGRWTETRSPLVTYVKQIGTPAYWTYHLQRERERHYQASNQLAA